MTMTKLAQAVAFASVLGVTVVAPVNAGGTGAHAQGTGAQDDTWTSQAAEQYNGRIPRAVYLDEMGRRWDANGNHAVTREQYLERMEQASVVNALDNLLTFPRLRKLIDRGSVTTHGAYFGVAAGALSVLNKTTGTFEPVAGRR